MDDMTVRPRYPRYSTINKKRRRNLHDDNTLIDIITRQVLISITALVIIIFAKSTNTPVTNYMTEKMKAITTSNIEIKVLYEWFDKATGKSRKEDANVLDENTFQEKEAGTGTKNSTQTGTTGHELEIDSALVTEKVEILDDTSDEVKEIKMRYNFVVPVQGVLSSDFGVIKDMGTGMSKFHKGIDIETQNGTSIKAALSGVVSESGSERTCGNYIKIRHTEGIETVYAHCSQILVEKGHEVKQGDTIAKVGDGGAFVGSHLHFEIWKDGKVINPLYLVDVPSF